MQRYFQRSLPRSSEKRRLWRSFASWVVDTETGVVSCDQKPLFQVVIGLEIHAQLEVSTKLFSSAKASISSSSVPNTAVHLFDVAVPGSLPRLSQEAVQQAVRTAAALQCHIPPVSRFERKHYAYADLPHGYQVTQQRWPLAVHGTLCCRSRRRKKRPNQSAKVAQVFQVDIDRIQLECDTGKTTNYVKQDQESWVDFNRAGCALVEIVMAPQLQSPRQAGVALDTLRTLLVHIGACNGRMEEGSLRCDLNISLSPIDKNDSDGGASARVEVKNLNSIRHVVKAAEYEAKRQAQELYSGVGEKRSETRTFDASTSRTILLRRKEGEDDYRFLPEPDLPPLVLNEETFGGKTLQEFLSETLPELPEAALARFTSDYGLSQDESLVLTAHPSCIQLFDQATTVAQELLHGEDRVAPIPDVNKIVANLMCNHLFALVKETDNKDTTSVEDDHEEDIVVSNFSKISGQQLGELVAMILEGKVSNTMAKQILTILYHNDDNIDGEGNGAGISPRQVAVDHGFELIVDPIVLRNLCREIVAEHPQQVEEYKKGGKSIWRIEKFFVGQAMARTKSNAHPERLLDAVQELLEEVAPGVKI